MDIPTLAEGCFLKYRGLRDVGVHTSDTLSKAGSFTCAAMQHMLSGLAGPSRVWHAAHALEAVGG